MLYLGIDCHRSFSHCTILDETGQTVFKGRMPHNEMQYSSLFSSLPDEKVVAVVEAGYGWGVIYEMLSALGVEVKVGHPASIRAIASARIKTDKRDSMILATLLRGDLIPEIYVPDKEERSLKSVLRERLSIVKERTRLKNKISNLLVMNRVFPEGITDIFGRAGRKHIDSLELKGHQGFLLEYLLDAFDSCTANLKKFEKYIKSIMSENRYYTLLKTVPGIGDTLAAVIAQEIHDISRFSSTKKFSCYCGLVPTVHSSGKSTYTGHLTKFCNKYLKTALVEASWSAIVHCVYLKSYYGKKKRTKKANVAICATARRLSEIIYHMLREDRKYEERYITMN